MAGIARNTVNQDAIAQACASIAAVSADWLLVDHAIVGAQRAHATGLALGLQAVPVLSGTPLAAFGEHGPHLWPLPVDVDDALLHHIRRWLSLEPTACGLSWVNGRQGPQALAKAIAYLCLVTADDDTRLHCRAADMRVLPGLLPVLSPQQRSRVDTAIGAWGFFDERGHPRLWAADAPDAAADPSPHLHLDKRQYAQVLQSSEPDIVFGLLQDKAPEVVPQSQLGDFRQRLAQFIATAAPYGVAETLDLLQFCVMSLTLGEAFHRHPALADTWKATRDGQKGLQAAMESWSDSLWNQLESEAAIQP